MRTIFSLISILATFMIGGFTVDGPASPTLWETTNAIHSTSHGDLGSSVAYGGTSSNDQTSDHGEVGPSVDPFG